MLSNLLQTAAQNGCVEMYRKAVENVDDKNPQIGDGQTFLHLVTQYGYVELCEAVVNNLVEKYSHSKEVLEMYARDEDLVFDDFSNFEGKLPKNSKGQSPLHIAAIHGHYNIFKLFVDKLLDVIDWQYAQNECLKNDFLKNIFLLGCTSKSFWRKRIHLCRHIHS